MKRTRRMCLLVAAGMLFVGCGGDDAVTTDTDAPPPTDRTATPTDAEPASTEPGRAECPGGGPTGEITVGTGTESSGFDTTSGGNVGAWNGHERAAVFDLLMQWDVTNSEWVPRMAESLESNDDATEWTLKLREGITFASGNPVDATAVEFAVERHGADDTVSQDKALVDLIDELEIVDPLTVVFHLSAPWGDFPSLLGGGVGMLMDPVVFEEIGAEAFAANPQGGGAGPYTVESFAPGEGVVLRARGDYWGGPVCIETVRFVQVDPATRRDAFLNGEFDVFYAHQPDVGEDIREAGFAPLNIAMAGGESVGINHGTGGVDRPGSDVRVRQAMYHALDMDLIGDRQFGGGVPTRALLHPDMSLWTPEIEGLPYDPERARELLNEAKADGYDGNITLVCHNVPDRVEWALAVEAQLEAVGFNVELDNQRSLPDWIGLYYQGAYDITCLNFAIEDEAPWSTLQTRIGQSDVLKARVGYESERMEAAMYDLRAAQTLDERAAAMVVVQQILNEEVATIPTNWAPRTVFAHPHVVGLEFTNSSTILFGDAYLQE